MGRLAHSWRLCKASAAVIRQDKELLWLPVLSFLASAIAVLMVAGIGAVGGVVPEATDAEGNLKPLAILLSFAVYVALAFVSLFFMAATVAGATERLKGGDPTVGSALRAAWGKLGKIFLWSLVVATVNVLLQILRQAARQSRSPLLGSMLAGVAGLAWNLATYFMVPVLLFEAEGIGGSVKRSAGLFKKTWGETVVGQAGVGFVGGIAGMAVAFVGILLTQVLAGLGAAGLVAGIALTVLGVVLVTVYFATLGGVYKAAIYQYAASGQLSPAFAPEDLRGQFQPR